MENSSSIPQSSWHQVIDLAVELGWGQAPVRDCRRNLGCKGVSKEKHCCARLVSGSTTPFTKLLLSGSSCSSFSSLGRGEDLGKAHKRTQLATFIYTPPNTQTLSVFLQTIGVVPQGEPVPFPERTHRHTVTVTKAASRTRRTQP